MKQEVDPKDTSRARAFELWMTAPNPMATFFKSIDVTRIVKVSKKTIRLDCRFLGAGG